MNPPWLTAIIDETLRAEGWPRYTNRPNDRGGATKGGVTIATLRTWRRYLRHVSVPTIEDLKALSEHEAREIYAYLYVIKPHFDEIGDELLRWQVVDTGIMSGPGMAAECLQSIAGVTADGWVGPITLARVNSMDPHALGIKLAAARIRFLGRLISRDRIRDQRENAAGWMNRATKFLDLEAERHRESRQTGEMVKP